MHLRIERKKVKIKGGVIIGGALLHEHANPKTAGLGAVAYPLGVPAILKMGIKQLFKDGRTTAR